MSTPRGFYLRFPCPECGAAQKVLPAQAGTEIRCSECPAVIVVPTVSELQSPSKGRGKSRKPGASPNSESNSTPAQKPNATPLELNVVQARSIAFACPVCHTMMRAAEEELGHAIMCPNCFSPVTVGGEKHKKPTLPAGKSSGLVLDDSGDDEYRLEEEPAARSPRTTTPRKPAVTPSPEPVSHNGDDEYRLSEDEPSPLRPARIPPSASPADDDYTLAEESAPRPAQRPRGDKPVADKKAKADKNRAADPKRSRDRDLAPLEEQLPVGWEIAAQAQRESQGEAAKTSPPDEDDEWIMPPHPFTKGVVGFMFHASTWPRWVGLALGTAIVYFFASSAVAAGMRGGGDLFYSLLFAVMASTAALLLVMFESVIALAIVQDTASGSERVDDWPDFIFLDWVGQAFYVINAAGFSVAPGFVAMSLVNDWGALRWIVPTLTFLTLFPIILLSQLDGGSPFSVLTPGVLKGIARWPLSWLTFYAVAALVVGIAAAGIGLTMLAAGWSSAFAAIAVGVFSSGAVMILSRLIGRLGWFCVEEEPVIAPTAPDADDEDTDRHVIE